MRNYYPNGVSPFAALQPLKEKMQEEQQKERLKRMALKEKRSKAMKKAWVKRKEKEAAQPVLITKKLRFENKQAYEDRLMLLSKHPEKMTAYEMMSSYFLDRLFWKKFGSGCHVIKVRNFKIQKCLWDGTYMSNSGKTRMGGYTAYFEITNEVTGKEREIGTQSVLAHINRQDKYGTNRRNDPDRNFGLPNSRGYR
jgi:hypothetical protein